MSIHTHNSKGFTLVETLVAISILAIAITGPLAIMGQNLQVTNTARDQVIATFLAQDAMEYVIAGKQQGVEQGIDWLEYFKKPGNSCVSNGNSSKWCQIDTTKEFTDSESIDQCNGADAENCNPLRLASDGSYQYSNGEETRFTRSVLIENIEDNREARVTVHVSWQSGLLQKHFEVNTNIFNTTF